MVSAERTSRLTSLECLQKEVLAKLHPLRDCLYLHFVMYCCFHLLVSHPTKTNNIILYLLLLLYNIYIALQYENGVSFLTVIENKRQLTVPYGRNHKRHSLQAGILNNSDE
jgi:hypothetical protein